MSGPRRQASDKEAFAKAMHTAFEDQLVQKVMPKLRGIDTRGKSKTECLDKIRGQIVAGIGGNCFNLAEDFDLACELGYGQFIWQSANYLSKMETTEPPSAKEAHTVESDDTDSIKTRPASSPVGSNATAASGPPWNPSQQQTTIPLPLSCQTIRAASRNGAAKATRRSRSISHLKSEDTQ